MCKSNVRWKISAFLWCCISLNFLDRAILAATAPYIKEEYNLTNAEMGIILSAFFWTYALFQIPQGWFADKAGQRISLALSVGWWSFATVATGVVASGFKAFLLFRMILGVGQAGGYTGCTGVVAKWFPVKERARATAIYDSGSTVGTAVAMTVIVAMSVQWGWRVPFIVFGILGFLWCAGWWIQYNEPEKHKTISREELEYIKTGLHRDNEDTEASTMKWYELLKYRNVWAMCLGFFTMNYAIYFFLTWFPTYLVEERGYAMMEMGWAAAVPPLSGLAGSIIGGLLMDKLYSKGYSLTFVRKLNLVGGMLIGTCIIWSGMVDSAVLSLVLMAVSYMGLLMASCAVWSLVSDIAPVGKASVLCGLQNTFSNAGGVLGPLVTGFIVTTTGSFILALIISGVGVFVGAMIYLFVLGEVKPLQLKNESDYMDESISILSNK
ncbi:MFS transporter [Citrobacter braakii]|uniref:MFS transporter n=1 Tax=Citrobacter braakii TaxID=57706 RepID=UPI00397A4BCA